ncbi:ankyrin repeat domain-containing protein [Verrucomicrobium sp. BvORR034]|uniref:ankyrin repeat domain-containing protein n=1 Tax=Verrucomicrobium sp. BvORR034 TaxID=1396418 RepID=UPI0006788129|nr:ankyrin repeat domain-containing protein [Verrucomicrobium sp. BvORR034]
MRWSCLLCALLLLGPAWAQSGPAAAAIDVEHEQVQMRDLYAACDGGDLAKVQALVKQGINVNGYSEEYGGKPFFAALARGYSDVVRLLILAGARVNEADPDGKTPLYQATRRGASPESAERMVEILLANGADVSAAGGMALEGAASQSVNLVKQLLAAGAKPTMGALAVSVSETEMEVFEYLIKEGGLDPNARVASHGGTLFHEATRVPMAARLLKLGLDINAQRDDGRTPLHLASGKGDVELSVWLLEHKANVNLADKEGRTPLMAAVGSGSYDEPLLPILLRAGGDPQIKDLKGSTVLDYAWAEGAWGNIVTLLDAKVEFQNAGETLCALFARAQSTPVSEDAVEQIVQRLLPRSGEFNELRVEGRSLLTCSVLLGQPRLTERLLNAGAKVNAMDSSGRTALIWSAMCGSSSARQLLLKAGANSHIKDASGRDAAAWEREMRQSVKGESGGRDDGSSLNPIERGITTGQVPKATHQLFFKSLVINDAATVRRLLTVDKNLLTDEQGGLRPLHLAAALGHIETAEVLLRGGAFLNEKTSVGETPLELAVRGGRSEMVTWLLDKAPPVLAVDMLPAAGRAALDSYQSGILTKVMLRGWTPERSLGGLRLALFNEDVELLRQLLAAGLDAKSEKPEEQWRKVPLLDVIEGLGYVKNPELARMLIRHWGLPLPAPADAALVVAMHQSASLGNTAVMATFIKEASLDINHALPKASDPGWEPTPQEEGKNPPKLRTALSLAVAEGRLETVKWLLDRGARIEGVDDQGWPPLCSAVASGNMAMIKLLIAKGASLQTKDGKGSSALDLAVEFGHDDVVALLRSQELGEKSLPVKTPLQNAPKN